MFLRSLPRADGSDPRLLRAEHRSGRQSVSHRQPGRAAEGRLATGEFPAADTWHAFDVTALGGRWTVRVDDKLVLEYNDPAPIRPRPLGLQSNQGEVAFRNLRDPRITRRMSRPRSPCQSRRRRTTMGGSCLWKTSCGPRDHRLIRRGRRRQFSFESLNPYLCLPAFSLILAVLILRSFSAGCRTKATRCTACTSTWGSRARIATRF